MSALTEKVAREHRYYPGLGICECGLDFEPTAPDYYDERELHTQHVVALTEAATRAAVAADIRAMYPEMSHHVLITERRQALYDGMREAARIAEGKPCSD